MTNFRMALLELLRQDEQGLDPQFLRDGVRLLAQELMDAVIDRELLREKVNLQDISTEDLAAQAGVRDILSRYFASIHSEVLAYPIRTRKPLLKCTG
jgi:hypothetical protein